MLELIRGTPPCRQIDLIFIKANGDPTERMRTVSLSVAVNGGECEHPTQVENSNNHKRSLTRYEFLNAIVRICEVEAESVYAHRIPTRLASSPRGCRYVRVGSRTNSSATRAWFVPSAPARE